MAEQPKTEGASPDAMDIKRPIMPKPSQGAIDKAAKAWAPLPKRAWDLDKAIHLLRRIGFAATPAMVRDLKGKSAEESVEFLLSRGESFPMPADVQNPERVKAMIQASLDEADAKYSELDTMLDAREAKNMMAKPEDLKLRRYYEKLSRQYTQELANYEGAVFDYYSHDWLNFAAKPENVAQEKLVMFMHNVLVVNCQVGVKGDLKVIYHYQKLLRDGLKGNFIDLCKKMSKSAAMMNMLDLTVNTKLKPNENFSRELMELFILGRDQGYVEHDIKEAARAFTGYKFRPGSFEFYLEQSEVDNTDKTIFGQTKNFNGDQVIDLIFEQDGAATHLVRELCGFYLNSEPIPEPFIHALGQQWREQGFDLPWLFKAFFSSGMFYHSLNRGKLVKSPIDLMIGLSLNLEVGMNPFPRRNAQFLRMMGQEFMNPPDVEGWQGGNEWINNATVQVRRVLIESFFLPVKQNVLTDEEKKVYKKMTYDGERSFHVDKARLDTFSQKENTELVDHLIKFFLPVEPDFKFRRVLISHMSKMGDVPRETRIKQVLLALLQSPFYQLA